MKRIVTISLLLMLTFGLLQTKGQTQFGEIQGKITNKETGEPVSFANVVANQEGTQKKGTTTDLDGSFRLKPLPPGTYEIHATFVGMQDLIIKGVQVTANKITRLDLKMGEKTLKTVEVVEYKKPLIEQDNNTTGGTMTEEEIKKAPTRSVNQLAGLTAGVSSPTGGTPNIKGSRSEGTDYYIDGVRVKGISGVPQGAISQLTVITGGVPAEYGDATGGIISITTRGPSRNFHGGVEVITSQFLDAYGYNLVEGNVSGPLIKKYKGTDSAKSILGFLIAGNVNYQKDPRPTVEDHWVVKDDVLDNLQEKPLQPNPQAGGFIQSAELITKDDMKQEAARPNVDRIDVNTTGKLDFQLSDNINLTAGGQYGLQDYTDYNYSYSLFNYENYRQVNISTYRGYLRYTQSFANKATPDEKSSGLKISDAYYTLQVDYTKRKDFYQDRNHKDNFFDYGYYGKYEVYQAPFFINTSDSVNGVLEEAEFQQGFSDTLVEFTPADINTTAGNYTKQYYNGKTTPVRNLQEISASGALVNGDAPSIVYSLWNNVGNVYPIYQKFDQDQFRFTASGSANLNNHAISLGIQYEQVVERSYGLAASSLWTIMRQSMNSHILQLDKDHPIAVYDDNGNFLDTVRYNRLDDGSQTTFDKNFRDKLISQGAKDVYGNPINELSYVNIDRYDPSMFSLDLFSASELMRTGAVFYRGYSYTGEKLDSKPSLNDFLNDENNRMIAPYNPIYVAGYIQDQFSFRDLIFRLGVRVDRFDANQPVLKDKYSLYPTRKAGEVPGTLNPNGSHPGNIGNDYVVYVDDPVDPTKIVGYRSGDDWYDENGAEIVDPNVLAFKSNTGTIAPYLTAENDEDIALTKESFKDYEPQVNVMPRIAFSFPISEDANFFANYDVLTQRPLSSTIAISLDDYLYLQQRATQTFANPALEPQKRTNYELGFKQALSFNSALTLTAYYGEIRNMVQLVSVNQAYPISYTTYQNIDFGTVKGFTATYDLRRTRTSNVQMQINYTLQFAEGTGSDAVSARSLVSAGQPNLRTPVPLDFDVRHNISVSFDYRYGSGNNYNGPLSKKGKQIFKNTGLNMIINANSGTPYSLQSNVTQAVSIGIAQQARLEGAVNGARKPFNYTIDLRLDRDFTLDFSKKEDNKETSPLNRKQPLILNAYIWIQNVLNTKNVQSVYRYTGEPDDDGFLASAEGQQVVESQVLPQAYIDQYSIKANNPFNYGIPRLIRIGATLNF